MKVYNKPSTNDAFTYIFLSLKSYKHYMVLLESYLFMGRGKVSVDEDYYMME